MRLASPCLHRVDARGSASQRGVSSLIPRAAASQESAPSVVGLLPPVSWRLIDSHAIAGCCPTTQAKSCWADCDYHWWLARRGQGAW